MGRTAVFAYGSLVSPASAAATLGGPVASAGPVRLEGWRRRWSLFRDNARSEKTFALEPGGELPPWILGLNIEPTPSAEAGRAPNGVLLEVDEDQLRRLDLRELRYDRVDVSDRIAAPAGVAIGTVVAYTAKPAQFAAEPPPGAVILSTYLSAVEQAFADLGEGELDCFRASTGPPPVPVVDGVLVRDRIPEGNPRSW